MKLLAIDPGTRRVGLAACDALGLSTRLLPVLRFSKKPQLIEDLVALIQREEIQKAVLGLPLNMDGTAGPAADRSRRWARDLAAALKRQGVSCDVVLWDERLSSDEAERRLRERGMAKQKARQILDSLAAEVLLEDYLAHHRRPLPETSRREKESS